MSLLNVGAGPRTSGFAAGWLSGELHPPTTSAPATVRTRAALFSTIGIIMAVLGLRERPFSDRVSSSSHDRGTAVGRQYGKNKLLTAVTSLTLAVAVRR
jgi:hypothetical protein